MHAYASSGTVTPTFTSTLQKRWTARSYSSPKLSGQQFFLFTLPSRQTDSNNDRFPWKPHSKVATPVSNSERRGGGDLHEECEQFVSAEVGAVTGTGSNELV